MIKILGINFNHADTSAAIIIDGKVIAAVEEERFNRTKHTTAFPVNAIKSCLQISGLNINDIDFISTNKNKFSNIASKILFTFSNLSISKNKLKKYSSINTYEINHIIKKNFKDYKKKKIFFIDHHLSHIASSCYYSNFDKCAVLSIDGFGDFASTVFGKFENSKIKILKKILFPNSLGIFYQAITQFLEFKNYGDEYKIMGLAPYGNNKYYDKLIKIFKKNDFFLLNKKYFNISNFAYNEINDSPIFKNLYNKNFTDLFNKKDIETNSNYKADLAFSCQNIYEEKFLEIINYLEKNVETSNIAISGGCGMNSVANGKIFYNSNFKNVFVQPAAYDAGGAIGSASYVYYNLLNNNYDHNHNYIFNPYLGPEYNNDNIYSELQKYKDSLQYTYLETGDLIESACEEIISRNVIAWFQGRMEWGARALGNRSIIADPRSKDIRDIINLKVKKREEFRPFAPSVLRESIKEWFDVDADIPFMMKVIKIKEKYANKVPAVVHVDGTCRVQTVTPELNNLYFKLINNFYKKTKVPMLLNTSFNENEPIVCTPKQAIECFLRTKLDALYLGNYKIIRK